GCLVDRPGRRNPSRVSAGIGADCLLVWVRRRRALWRKALVMWQTNHTVYVANDKRLRYEIIGRWREPSAGSSPARAAEPPCGALCTPRKGLVRAEATPLPRLTALATQNRLARAVTLVRCKLHEPPDRAFLIRLAPSLLPAFEGAERYAQK